MQFSIQKIVVGLYYTTVYRMRHSLLWHWTIVDMYCLLHGSLAVFQVQDILGNRVLESDSEKEEISKQWTDSTQSRPCAPLIHNCTGGERVL
jgi:hypothetical protein